MSDDTDDTDDDTVTIAESEPIHSYNDMFAERADCMMRMAMLAHLVDEDCRPLVLQMMHALIGQVEREGRRSTQSRLSVLKSEKTE